MEENLATETALGETSTPPPHVEETSAQYLGRWHRLVSTTNWEKGRILCEWRGALIDSGAPASLYSDDAWSQRVGGVTPQHVGRLRRVFERFGGAAGDYPGLYWSHFQAALDWDDAEMWLEGAVQNGWSVARMRQERVNTLGAVADLAPQADSPPWDVDEDAASGEESPPDSIAGSLGEVRAPAGDDGAGEEAGPDAAGYAEFETADDVPAADSAAVQPFAGLPAMPDDLGEAFEAFKVAILNHKLSGWQEISCGEVVMVLDALKRLALAPAEG